MGQLRSSSEFFLPGAPAPVGAPDREIVEYLLKRVEGKILDLGGGLGAYAQALKNAGYLVTLAEKSPFCLAEAQKIGITTIDMNITPWEELHGKFETIILIEVLEHVEQYREFLTQIVGCNPKIILLTVPCFNDFQELFNNGLTYNHVAVSDHLHQFTSSDISMLLTELDLKHQIKTGAYLFPNHFIWALYKAMHRNLLAKFLLFPFKLFQVFQLLPRRFPSRIFAEIHISGSDGHQFKALNRL